MPEPFLGELKKVTTDKAGWRELKIDQPSKAHTSSAGTVKKSLLNLVHISDTHICDAQSPAPVADLEVFMGNLWVDMGSLMGRFLTTKNLRVNY
jgi:hypothetical protein